jgi:hypothetical protein
LAEGGSAEHDAVMPTTTTIPATAAATCRLVWEFRERKLQVILIVMPSEQGKTANECGLAGA